jgi:hypothetical protein
MEFFIGFSSSAVASSITYPVDLVKTQYQRYRLINPNMNTTTIIKNIYKQKGYFGFYRGMLYHLSTYPIFWSLFFSSNSYFQNKTNIFFGSLLASNISSIIANPLFVIKTRLQTEIMRNQSNVTNLIKNIYIHEGLRGFYKGSMMTIMNNSKLSLQFPIYDYLKLKTDNVIFSACTAKIISSLIFYPFDIIRTNQRDSITKISAKYIFKHIYMSKGFYGFYQGSILYCLSTCPNFVIMLFFRDLFLYYYNNYKN